ncbi:hypothetical protein Syun_026318 [Stephania yunnanensis]|uniref:Uncharacterized protein n=1 Tax=Stephania yunnanensis TaxID=152371 RepID=A0AAP0EYU8_9MAGN
MGSLEAMLKHPEDVYPLLKLGLAAEECREARSLPSRTGPSVSPCSTRSPEASPSSSNNSAPIFATPSAFSI